MTKEKQKRGALSGFAGLVFFFFLANFLYAGEALGAEADGLPLFQEEEVIKITLEAPLKQLIKAARTGRDTFEGSLVLHLSEGPVDLLVKVSPRGNSRRTGGFCRFPPLKIDFNKKQVSDTLFQGQNKLKLVTHCQKSSRYQDLYLREYAVYKVFNILTPLSFRVRMAEVTYINTEGKMDPLTRYGFFIEDIDDVGDRAGLEELKIRKINRRQLDPKQATLYAIFEYFIGNLDWSNTQGGPGEDCCHNSKLLAPSQNPDGGGIIPVPYDFDFSGLVDAPYATPPPNISVNNVRQRLFRGYCIHNGEVAAIKTLFLEKENQLRAVFEDEGLFSEKSRVKTLNYIDSFFETLKNPKKSRRAFQGKCLN
ncbi:MAG: hypothetical protein V3R64_07920 [Sphingomonadales bacterium]